MWIEPVAKVAGGPICFPFHYETTEPRGMTQQVMDTIQANGRKVGNDDSSRYTRRGIVGICQSTGSGMNHDGSIPERAGSPLWRTE